MLRVDSGPREHDYTRNMWGHALHDPKIVGLPQSFWDRLRKKSPVRVLKALGHGDVRKDDTILLRMQSGKIARFIVREIEYFHNPRDMFDLKRADFVEYVT